MTDEKDNSLSPRDAPSDELVEATRLLQVMHDQLEDAMCNCTQLDGQVWEYGKTDLQLTPDGSVSLSDVRRFLQKATGGDPRGEANPESSPSSIRSMALEEAAKVGMKAGVAFMDSSPVSDPEGTLVAAMQAIRALTKR